MAMFKCWKSALSLIKPHICGSFNWTKRKQRLNAIQIKKSHFDENDISDPGNVPTNKSSTVIKYSP